MSTRFKLILPGAWQLIQDVKYEIYFLQVPVAWQQVAKSLSTKRANKGHSKYPSVPVSSLDSILAASFPQIIKTERGGWRGQGIPWLFATETPDLSDLSEFIKDWLREEFEWCLGEAEVNSALHKLKNDDWHWNEKPITNPLWKLPQSNYKTDFRFDVLPDYLAGEFLKNREISFGKDNQYRLRFYRTVSLDKGTQIISWPPHPVPLIKGDEQVGTAHISFVIRFTLQTVPWQHEPMIYHQLSIRRWLTDPIERLPYRGATVYIGDNHRWLDGSDQPFCLMRLAMKQAGRPAKWSKAISELLKINDSPLPDPNNLAKEPKHNWSDFRVEPTGVQAAISYDSRHRGEAPCLPGISPLDLASLDRAIQEQLPVCRVGEAVRVEVKRQDFWGLGKPRTPMLRPEITAPANFRQRENSPHTVLILWETEECRDTLIATILKLLSLSNSGETTTYMTPTGVQGEESIYTGEEGPLRIKTQHVEDLTQRLDFDNPAVEGKKNQQKRTHLMEERIRNIALSLPKPEELSGALIEIKPKQSFFPSECDPKLALRIGAMQAGYVNQHIHALTGSTKRKPDRDQNRAERAVSDLLRQFGILPAPLIDLKKDGIDPYLWLTCFHVVRRTRKTTANNKASSVVLMVRVNPVTGIVQVTTPSLFPKWELYPDALGYLITEKWDVDSYGDATMGEVSDEQQPSDIKREQQLLNKFVSDCLRDCLSTPIEQQKNSRVLFMAEAQNARRMLTWLQNPQLPANDLPKALDLTESQKNRLWLVRLRVAEDGEVPVGIVKGSPGSRSSIGGVFHWQNVCDGATGLYLSLRKLLTTEQHILRQSQSRLENGSKPAGNPKLLEIALVHHPGIEPDQLAGFIHHLRGRWPYFADDVSLPFPFPFATLAQEYAVSAFDVIESVDLEELED